ncbi:hypothetical protein B0I35DRAFT_440111 [Stachybotrys elegans]|uniref:Uncharacterized protein n=1 Tax=Stachybotrys elegans TaxID=80388 RepID=A0A8K0SJN1_9HYPO|nr:hypothetical protein B0I35DRAFT_440111 [Stachybotrys elegans]
MPKLLAHHIDSTKNASGPVVGQPASFLVLPRYLPGIGPLSCSMLVVYIFTLPHQAHIMILLVSVTQPTANMSAIFVILPGCAIPRGTFDLTTNRASRLSLGAYGPS